MIDPVRPPVHPRLAATPPDHVDGLLSRFFRSEMPNPWPACPCVSQEEALPTVPWKRVVKFPLRVAVAAAVAGLVVGYVGLQRWIPEPRPLAPSTVDMTHPMGMNLKTGQFIDHTKTGEPVRGEVEKTTDPKKYLINLRIEELPAKK